MQPPPSSDGSITLETSSLRRPWNKEAGTSWVVFSLLGKLKLHLLTSYMAASFRPPHCFIHYFFSLFWFYIGPEVVSLKANLQRYSYLRLQDPDSLSRRHYNYLLHTVPTWLQKRSASGRTETPALSPPTNMLILYGYLDNPFSNIMEVLCDLITNNTLDNLTIK